MLQRISAVALVVEDYDDAIRYFTHCLRFTLVEDTPLSPSKRWVVVRPPGGGTALLLARAASAAQSARVGDQTGGRVFLFPESDDFWQDHAAMVSRGVRFTEEPRAESHGLVANGTEISFILFLAGTCGAGSRRYQGLSQAAAVGADTSCGGAGPAPCACRRC